MSSQYLNMMNFYSIIFNILKLKLIVDNRVITRPNLWRIFLGPTTGFRCHTSGSRLVCSLLYKTNEHTNKNWYCSSSGDQIKIERDYFNLQLIKTRYLKYCNLTFYVRPRPVYIWSFLYCLCKSLENYKAIKLNQIFLIARSTNCQQFLSPISFWDWPLGLQ